MGGCAGWFSKDFWIKSIKIAVAASLSVTIAGMLGLKYSITAGIITVLSIQNTKKETLRVAVNRALAFGCALVIAAFSYYALGFTVWAFAVYLLFFTLLCQRMGWADAISMNAVLVTHFLGEKNMSLSMIGNEAIIFGIGAGMGILANLHLHRRQGEFERLAGKVDTQIKGILYDMSRYLVSEDKGERLPECFTNLEESIKEAGLCAALNYNNQFFAADGKELAYIQMRKQQSVVLEGIYENINSLRYLPTQAVQVAGLLQEIETGYHKNNTVEGLLLHLEQFFEIMKREKLPEDREEFEARAILFYVLKQIEKLLLLKREFILQNGMLK